MRCEVTVNQIHKKKILKYLTENLCYSPQLLLLTSATEGVEMFLRLGVCVSCCLPNKATAL